MTWRAERRPGGNRPADQQTTVTNDRAERTALVDDPVTVRAALEALDPAAVGAVLSLLHPDDALVVAARLGVEMNEARRDWRRMMRETSSDVHGAMPRGYWRDWATHRVPHAELERRRGVEIGPDGRRRIVRRPSDTRPDYPGRGAA
jgi:hypothetical protein